MRRSTKILVFVFSLPIVAMVVAIIAAGHVSGAGLKTTLIGLAAMVLMVALGSILGGRHTPNVAPRGHDDDEEEDAAEGSAAQR